MSAREGEHFAVCEYASLEALVVVRVELVDAGGVFVFTSTFCVGTRVGDSYTLLLTNSEHIPRSLSIQLVDLL